MKIWQFLLSKLNDNQTAALLLVTDNKGSSPGRKGFKMAVSEDGEFESTIGGGIMEVKFLELAKSKLKKGDFGVIIKRQFHDKKHASNQSGMICSGEQTIAIIPLTIRDLPTIHSILKRSNKEVKISIVPTGIRIAGDAEKEKFRWSEKQRNFEIIITVNAPKRVHIFGGGHVGLALSEVLATLDYYVLIYDDRPNLNTLKQNQFADEIHIIDYEKAAEFCDFKANDSVVIVTFSYRTDKILLRQFYQKSFAYFGMMGSESKIETLFEELEKEGILKDNFSHLFAPIGLDIFSKTAKEIAVSIAGQMILERNKNLSTGRTSK